MSAERFVDTNVVLYLLSHDGKKADRAEAVLAEGPVVSVQVLNEFTNVARRKLGMSWTDIGDFSELLRALCRVEPITIATHDLGRQLAERYQLSVYDSMIAASALLAGCETLYSEDMHAGLRVEDRLTIENPFDGRPH
ncbi:PIN domain-containing protein [Variovorax ginsengisoli]|uniref:Ribonuclease VapC n=1 Tax=Variovorax ginsengisoli TaxID=363844 RepID=A0ABT8S613_9BURK|nr:PIN domain-containing protein [Variovorax ginsengisoli]MDN8614534.1 PIN domain-containing protein [Variovorax ginsengisoli]MDO1533704.1 PIN domain-containing protein [Variovorax ginsengisoli]